MPDESRRPSWYPTPTPREPRVNPPTLEDIDRDIYVVLNLDLTATRVLEVYEIPWCYLTLVNASADTVSIEVRFPNGRDQGIFISPGDSIELPRITKRLYISHAAQQDVTVQMILSGLPGFKVIERRT